MFAACRNWIVGWLECFGGREHTPEQAAESVTILRDAGLEEINIDLMFAIPGQSDTDWQHTLDTAVALKPDHISAYNLTYEEDTAFIERLTQGEYNESEDTNADHFSLADKNIIFSSGNLSRNPRVSVSMDNMSCSFNPILDKKALRT